MVLAEAHAAGVKGLGFSYANKSTAVLIQEKLAAAVTGSDAMDIQGKWERMVSCLRSC